MLVSVAVTCYNSAEYVVETLESIKRQTYSPLELIISDDCSRDNTLAIVQAWIANEGNTSRFTDVKLITVPKNTGVSANCNRCIAAATSEWVKFIAGDDILLPGCIEDNMAFAVPHPAAHIIFSQVNVFQDDFDEDNYKYTTPDEFPVNLMHDNLTAEDQYKLLLVSDRIYYTPSYFFNKQALAKVGGYDETNRLVEDYPMWLKLTRSGERLFYFHKPTVGYRIHSKAINNVGDDVIFKPSLLNSYAIRKIAAHPYLPWEMVKSEQFVYQLSRFFQSRGLNHKKYMGWYDFARFYLNPFYVIFALKKRMPSNKHNPFYQ